MRRALVIAVLAACARPATTTTRPPPTKTRTTAKREIDFAGLARDLLAEINLVRADPRGYAEHLVALRRYYDGALWNVPGRDPIRTKEGVQALDEAVRALRKAKRATPLERDPAMSRASADHVADIGPRASISHDGANGSQPFTRLARYGVVIGSGAESIGVAFTDPRIVIHQIVDDGVPDRGHRDNILSRAFGRVGVACGPRCPAGYVVSGLDISRGATDDLFLDLTVSCSELGADGTTTGTTTSIYVNGTLDDANNHDSANCAAGTVARRFRTRCGAGFDQATLHCALPSCQ